MILNISAHRYHTHNKAVFLHCTLIPQKYDKGNKKNFRASAALSLNLEKISSCCFMTSKICGHTERTRKYVSIS